MYKIKCSGIYKIQHISGYYYIGMSVDIFSRFSSHYTKLKTNKHTSTKFNKLWNETNPNEWTFTILEYVSVTDFKKNGLKGKDFVNNFRKLLLNKEKEWMKKHSINWCLNKNNKNFS